MSETAFPSSFSNESAPLFSRIQAIFLELHRRNPVLSLAGGLMIAGFIVASAAYVVDGRTVAGVSVWLKPMKFAISIAVYLWTLAWLVHYLESRRAVTTSHLIALVMVLEFVLIFSQSARGTASHFNSATTYDIAVYRAMGVLILANTLAVGYLGRLYFEASPRIAASYLLGIRLGFSLFLFTAVSGGIMIAMVSHSVGEAGDLRVAHFIGMHALQSVPAAGFITHHLHERRLLSHPARWTAGFAVVVFLVHTLALLLASEGKSVL